MPRTPDVDRQQLLDLWQTPRTLIEIGVELGCSSSTVYRLKQQHGLPPRERRPPPDVDVSPEEDAASADSLRFSPWVASRIRELGLGVRA